MGQNIVKIVDDGTLANDEGWAFGVFEDTGEIYFVTERSAMTDETKINEVWQVAAGLVLEQAVREGIVEWVDPEKRRREPDGFSGGRRIAI